MSEFRKLNQKGLEIFKEYLQTLKNEEIGVPPFHLCNEDSTSERLGFEFNFKNKEFKDRVELGEHLVQILGNNAKKIIYDPGFWNALTLKWFDIICPPDKNGKRHMRELACYVFGDDGAHNKGDRHFLWGAWWAISTHGRLGHCLLLAPKENSSLPLTYHGELMNRLGGNNKISSISNIIKLAEILYADPDSKRPKKGTSGRGKGTPIRLIAFLDQLGMTFELSTLTVKDLSKFLPEEFNKWKQNLNT